VRDHIDIGQPEFSGASVMPPAAREILIQAEEMSLGSLETSSGNAD
jgi:hypothetical protein